MKRIIERLTRYVDILKFREKVSKLEGEETKKLCLMEIDEVISFDHRIDYEIMEVKQIIIIRRDLKCRRGKEISQGSHSSIAFLVKKFFTGENLTRAEAKWMKSGQKIVCLQIDSEEGLLEIHQKALALGLESNLVIDSGATEFGGVPTKTCLSIGPDNSDKIDKITGELKLY
jgi:PTH2 family peptidyl-tRNA hydrolase